MDFRKELEERIFAEYREIIGDEEIPEERSLEDNGHAESREEEEEEVQSHQV